MARLPHEASPSVAILRDREGRSAAGCTCGVAMPVGVGGPDLVSAGEHEIPHRTQRSPTALHGCRLWRLQQLCATDLSLPDAFGSRHTRLDRVGRVDDDVDGIRTESGQSRGRRYCDVDQQRQHHAHVDVRQRGVEFRIDRAGRHVQPYVLDSGNVHLSLHHPSQHGGNGDRSVALRNSADIQPRSGAGVGCVSFEARLCRRPRACQTPTTRDGVAVTRPNFSRPCSACSALRRAKRSIATAISPVHPV